MFFRPSHSLSMLMAGLFFSLVLTPTAGAETKGGDLEINTSVSYINTDTDEVDDDNNTLSLIGRLGYFFTPAINTEGALQIIGNSNGDTDFLAVAFNIRANYHFNTSGTVIPYLGPAVGITHTAIDADGFDESETGGSYGGQVGLKSFLTETVAITTEWSLTRTAGFEFDSTVNAVFVGISYFWR